MLGNGRQPASDVAPAATVLVVDDDPFMLEALACMLEDASYAVERAAGGAEALARVGRRPAPALVVLDLMMPDVTGWDVLAELSGASSGAPPVVVVSAMGVDALADAEGFGARAALPKPVRVAALLGAVARALA
ncbi:MAG TPA: response regulator [Minicystis sp.]|nr:response regulator [Minicystis sp.]